MSNSISKTIIFFLFALAFTNGRATAQGIDSSQLLSNYPFKMFQQIETKTSKLSERIQKKTSKYLFRLEKEELKLLKHLYKHDTSALKAQQNEIKIKYQQTKQSLSEKASKFTTFSNTYLPRLDSLQTALKFFEKTTSTLGNFTEKISAISASSGIESLTDRLNKMQEVRNFIDHRKNLLQNELKKLGKIKKLNRFSEQAYYYQHQITEYRSLINEPSKLISKFLNDASEIPTFKKFFEQNSQLAVLFKLPVLEPDRANVTLQLTGLQTRAGLTKQMVEQFGSDQYSSNFTGDLKVLPPNLETLKDRLFNNLGTTAEQDLKDFKPNLQKTRSFFNRLEIGSNLQTSKSNQFFPSTTDLGISLGYKVNDKSIVGLGASYKLGWGKDYRHMILSHEGVGLRSFLDYKLQRSFWLSGGVEMNYLSQFDKIDVLKDFNEWQRSALLGVSKKYSASKRLNGNIQLLYDFLWKDNTPRTSAFIFRLGYALKK